MVHNPRQVETAVVVSSHLKAVERQAWKSELQSWFLSTQKSGHGFFLMCQFSLWCKCAFECLYMEVSVTQQIPECEKHRQGGRDSHQREEIVGSAASFIAALMSPGTHRLETAVLFSPPPGSTNPIQLLTHRNTCTFRAGHTGAHRLPHTL